MLCQLLLSDSMYRDVTISAIMTADYLSHLVVLSSYCYYQAMQYRSGLLQQNCVYISWNVDVSVTAEVSIIGDYSYNYLNFNRSTVILSPSR